MDRQIKRFENTGFFGDFALLNQDGKRSATCTASCLPGHPVVTLRLTRFEISSVGT
jgi:hypothetical protein